MKAIDLKVKQDVWLVNYSGVDLKPSRRVVTGLVVNTPSTIEGSPLMLYFYNPKFTHNPSAFKVNPDQEKVIIKVEHSTLFFTLEEATAFSSKMIAQRLSELQKLQTQTWA